MAYMKKLTMAVVAATMSMSVNAEGGGDLFLFHNFYTNHPKSGGFKDKAGDKGYQEDNDVSALRYTLDERWSVGVGGGENSYYKESYLLAVEYRREMFQQHVLVVDWGVDGILATGYEDHTSAPAVMLVPQLFLRAGTEDVKVKVGMIGIADVITVNGEIKLYNQ